MRLMPLSQRCSFAVLGQIVGKAELKLVGEGKGMKILAGN